MILNSESVQMIRTNSARLAACISSKDDLADLATAGNYEQVFFAIETLLANTDMYFDDDLLLMLNDDTWKNFKALLMVYTLNIVNMGRSRNYNLSPQYGREFQGATPA